MDKVKQSYWCMEGRHNDEVHCTNCNHAVGVQYDEEDNITGVPMVCPKCKSQMSNPIKVHSWMCPNCGVSMVTGTSQSFSNSSGI